MKAGTLDLTVETGATFEFAARTYAPTGDPVPAGNLVPGDRVYYGELPEYVYAVEPWTNGGTAMVTVRLRYGLWDDPTFTAPAAGMVRMAQPVAVRAAQLGITYVVVPADEPSPQPLIWPTPPAPVETRLLVPTTVEDGDTVLAQWTDADTHALTAGTYDWDLYVQIDSDGSWVRLLEGSCMVIRGATRNEVYFDA